MALSSYYEYGGLITRKPARQHGARNLEEHGMNGNDGVRVLEAVVTAINRRDLDGLTQWFADGVRSTTPAHPARSFVGREQVRRNWSQIFGAIGDIEAELLSSATTGERVWAELQFRGHRPDGAPWQMRGVTISEVRADRIEAVEFYMEPVELEGVGPDSAVLEIVEHGASGSLATNGGPR
jgi:ketosteroid isomerase-like protein